MGEIVNLNKRRKHRRRLAEKKQASENRLRFGRGKIERTQTKAENDRATKSLDDKRLD
jgi:hypothetical protein